MRQNRARSPVSPWNGVGRLVLGVFLLLGFVGCSTSRPVTAGPRPFDFSKDTFSYANELVWEYYFDEQGRWTHRAREPRPEYSHHCFVVARSAKQFFDHATFDPDAPPADRSTYRERIREVISTSPRKHPSRGERVVIPGYGDLREFSVAWEELLKRECGSWMHSYFQRGHWRMIFPFSRTHQEGMAVRLANAIRANRPPVVHLVQFPSLGINHASLLFGVTETWESILFDTYDPNAPERPVTLTYDRTTRTFSFPTNSYFPGGRVDVYEAYAGWLY